MSAARGGSAHDQILDAALHTMYAVGIRRTTVDAIAAQAGVSHMSVYRRWATKNELLRAVMAREMELLFAAIDARLDRLSGIDDKVVDAFSTLYRFLHTHPLVGRAIRADPDTMLPLLTLSVGAVITSAATHFAQLIGRGATCAGDTVKDPDALAEVVARIIHSLLLSPSSAVPATSQGDVADYARRHVVPLLRAEVGASDPLAQRLSAAAASDGPDRPAQRLTS